MTTQLQLLLLLLLLLLLCFRRFSVPHQELKIAHTASGICQTVTATCWAPDDGRKTRLKHVERLTEINKLCNVASCWLYSAKKSPILSHRRYLVTKQIHEVDCLRAILFKTLWPSKAESLQRHSSKAALTQGNPLHDSHSQKCLFTLLRNLAATPSLISLTRDTTCDTMAFRWRCDRYYLIWASHAWRRSAQTLCIAVVWCPENKETCLLSVESSEFTSVAYPEILWGGGRFNKFNWGQRERGSGGGSHLVRGSGGSCNLVQEISFDIVKFS